MRVQALAAMQLALLCCCSMADRARLTTKFSMITADSAAEHPHHDPHLALHARSRVGSHPVLKADDSMPPGLTHVGTILPRHSGAATALTVWEDLRTRGGPISFYGEDNTTLVRTLTKRDVDAGLRNATKTGSNATCCGQGFKLSDLVNLGPDL